MGNERRIPRRLRRSAGHAAGPLFTFAAYLGAAMLPLPNGALGALIGTGIVAPSFLLITGVLPFWDTLRQKVSVQAAAST